MNARRRNNEKRKRRARELRERKYMEGPRRECSRGGGDETSKQAKLRTERGDDKEKWNAEKEDEIRRRTRGGEKIERRDDREGYEKSEGAREK